MDKSKTYVDDAATNTNGVEIDSAKKPEKERTPGLKIFDVFLYPIVTNFSVFAISVAATYLTTRGGDRNTAGKLVYGKVGSFFHKRGEWLVGKFESWGMTHGQADMGKMVFFSFLDGSLVAPLVKLVEDKREKIGFAIDHRLGTKPEDLSVYAEEPKQSWLSVLGGRFATAAIVVPTAVALDKTGLNDKLFNDPGKKVGVWITKQPGIAKWFGKLDVRELSRIGFFEAFYTSVCTAGLYFTSRGMARLLGDKWNIGCKPVDKTIEAVNSDTADKDNRPYCPPGEEPTPKKFIERLKRPLHRDKGTGGFRDNYLSEAGNRRSFLAV